MQRVIAAQTASMVAPFVAHPGRSTQSACSALPSLRNSIARVPVALRHASQRPSQACRLVTQARVKYDESATKVNPAQPAFTRRREIFVGRLAMLGFFAATIGELITGKGALGQLSLETALSGPVVDAIALAFVGYSLIGALAPSSPTFSDANQKDVRKRPKGPTQDPTIYPGEVKKFFGITNIGFTKKNELFVGRVAMLGFAFALIGEKLTDGKGPLAQIGIPLGQPLNPSYAGVALAVWIGLLGFGAIGYNNFGQKDGDEEIY